MRVALLAVTLAVPAAAGAQDAEPVDDGGAPAISHPPITNRINLRVGTASTDETGYPTICMDVRVVSRFALESCGTGQGILHNEPGTEMAHFRATYAFLERPLWKGDLHARGGLGFAEMQIGTDSPGFRFGSPDQDRGSVSGPEASLSAQWLVPMYKDLDFVITGTAGLAYFIGAPELATSKSELQSFASIEAGIGW